jgi:hypothetical protein
MNLFLKEKTVPDNLLLALDNPAEAERQRRIRLMTTKKTTEESCKLAGDLAPVIFRPSVLKDLDATIKANNQTASKST